MYLMHASLIYYDSENKANAAKTTVEQWKKVFEECVSTEEQADEAAERFVRGIAEDKYWSFDEIITVEGLAALTDMGLRVNVRRVKGMFSDVASLQPSEILAIAQKSRSEVHVHVPGGVALTSITQVEYMEDACTNALQDKLNEGWRIIAVCPANDTRRPTYILGK